MSELKPIRAWARYDDGDLWIDMHDVQEMDAPAVFVPSTAEGVMVYVEAVQDHTDDWSLPGLIRWWGDQRNSKPLRSLRVLLSNGHGFGMGCATYERNDGLTEDFYWWWDADKLTGKGHDYDVIRVATDAEAVEHALTEAIAYFAAQDATT